MSEQAVSSDQQDIVSAVCGSCKAVVEEEDAAVECTLCNMWHHINCENVSRELYRILMKNQDDSVQWYCGKCKLVSRKIINHLTKMENRQDCLEAKLTELENEMEKANDQLNNVRNEFEAKLVYEKSEITDQMEQRFQKFESDLNDKVTYGDVDTVLQKLHEVEDSVEKKDSMMQRRLDNEMKRLEQRVKQMVNVNLDQDVREGLINQQKILTEEITTVRETVRKELEGRKGIEHWIKSVEDNENDKVMAEVKVALDTEKDKLFRARNIMLANVPEPNTDDMVTGKAWDLEFVNKLFTADMGLSVNDFKISDTTRLSGGQNSTDKQERNYQENPRLLRIRFENAEMVGTVASATGKLQYASTPIIKKIRIFRDKPKAEREERRKLISLAVKKNEDEENADEFKWIVDYKKKDIIRVPKENSRQMTFRQRRYR